MRSRLLACLLVVCCLAFGQNNKMSVEQLINFVQSSQKIIKEDKTMTDKQLADFLSKVVLTEKLEAGVIEDLQALGIGPFTVKSLERLRTASQSLTKTTVTQVLPDEPIPPPSSLQQGAVLDDVRKYVANYNQSLPDFICTEIEHRQVAPPRQHGGEPSFQEMDMITSKMSYFNQKEEKKAIMVNSRPTTQDYRNLGGATSEGDFATMLKMLFERRTQARFEWARWATLRSRRTQVYSFRVERANSDYTVALTDLHLQTVMGYTGEVFVDEETHQVTRLKMSGIIPADFPMNRVSTQLDYDYTDIGGQPFLLPLYGEVQMEVTSMIARNLLEFRFYKKYSADSAISYDIPKDYTPMPDSKLQETPAVDCKDPKNKDNAACKK